MFRAYQPGSVCATQANPFSGLARAAGVHRLLAHYRADRLFWPCSLRPTEVAMSATPRTELESKLHRLSNYIECQLSDLIRELLNESRTGAVHGLAWSGSRFIENLREVRDGKECDD
jgi:hypothetical protein